MLDRAQKLSEIFSFERPPMLLLAKHDGVVEVEDNAGIGAAQRGQLARRETESLEEDNHVMLRRLPNHSQATSQIGSTCRQHGRLDTHFGIMCETVAQTQTRTGSVAMFDHTKSSHAWGIIAACSRASTCFSQDRQRPPEPTGKNLISAYTRTL